MQRAGPGSSLVSAGPATLEKPALSAVDFRFGPIVSSGAASTPPDACSDSALGRSAAADGMRHAKPAEQGKRQTPARLQGTTRRAVIDSQQATSATLASGRVETFVHARVSADPGDA